MKSTRLSIAKSVGLAAIRYDIVKVSPEKSTVFDWKEALDFERQSGPYIQYTHARACTLLEKAAHSPNVTSWRRSRRSGWQNR